MDTGTKEIATFLSISQEAVERASLYLLKHWGKTQKFITKESHHSIVTTMDVQSESIVADYLQQKVPDHSLISEERGRSLNENPFVWVLDPLDGSSYYMRGLRSFSISLALLYKWQPILGIVACPAHNEVFTATLGSGSFLNGVRIYVSEITNVSEAILGFSHRFLRGMEYFESRQALVPACRSIRGGGSCAQELCYVACGRMDSFIAPAQSLWDFAAGSLIVTEAQGGFSGFVGECPEYPNLYEKDFPVLATNSKLHDFILSHLSNETSGSGNRR